MVIRYIVFVLLLSTNVFTSDVQFNLYNTESIKDDHSCLYYYIQNDIEFFHITDGASIVPVYELVPYCLRSSDIDQFQHDVIPSGKQSMIFTFEGLRLQHISSYELYTWSASIDLAEEYEIYLNQPTVSDKSLVFYNCTSPWFGNFCQYSFEFPASHSFTDILQYIFLVKEQSEHTQILSCYVYLICDRGSDLMCLDWREICDESVDCSDGIDEENCWAMDLSECDEYEYRCHNGQCIPKEYLLDDRWTPECIDGTDELVRHLSSLRCKGHPAIRCEDYMCPRLRYSSSFVCGGGDCAHENQGRDIQCKNKRDIIWEKTLVDNITDLSPTCKIAMICMTQIVSPSIYNINCDEYCQNRSCYSVIQEFCPLLFEFPATPIVFNHIYFVYSNNESDYNFNKYTPPTYICYNESLCNEFLLSTERINNRACRRYNETVIEKSIHSFGFHWKNMIFNVKYTFQACLSIHQSAYEQFRNHSTIFRCNNSSKIIWRHRLNDGYRDCHENDDEIANACTLENEYRFKCSKKSNNSSGNICVLPHQMMDGYRDCPDGEDERDTLMLIDFVRPNRSKIDFNNFWSMEKVEQYEFFPQICNGFQQQMSTIIDGQYHSDETECDDWPCNNVYSRCDSFWSCQNGQDELNCKPSKCLSMEHLCVSPSTRKLGCLPLEKAGDNITDCLGGTDELKQCQNSYFTHNIFQCSGTSSINCLRLTSLCNKVDDCTLGDDENFCQNYLTGPIRVCSSPTPTFNRSEEENFFCRLSNILTPSVKKHFTISNLTDYTLSIESPKEYHIQPQLLSIEKNLIYNDSLVWIQRCKRGINVYAMSTNSTAYKCLCPPAYYGNTCEYQNQRVSLTIKIRTINAWHTMFTIVLLLINDEDQTIESSEQIEFISKEDCGVKHHISLLYSTRPKDKTKNHSIRIDVFNRHSMEYYGSWSYPVKFSFLPIYRMAIILIVPGYRTESTCNTLNCGSHGECLTYMNSGNAFCRCNNGWSGQGCLKDGSVKFSCAPNSLTVGTCHNRSICVCPLDIFGSRCYLQDKFCPDHTCKNGGTCIIRDKRILNRKPACICMDGYSGANCEIKPTRIDISLKDVSIPSAILIHFITAHAHRSESRVTIFRKIPVDQTSVSVYISSIFHLIFVEFYDTLYFAHAQYVVKSDEIIKTIIEPSHQCLSIDELLDKNITKFHRIRRIKRYPLICQQYVHLSCFYDDTYICFCYNNNTPNCFIFDRNSTYNCQGYNYCQNDGKCFQNDIDCPTSSMCACENCYYGSRCQLSSKGFGLSLDLILGPHIYPNNYSLALQTSIIIVLFLTILGLVNAILSFLTFRSKKSRQSSSALYLLTSSFTSALIILFFSFKFWFLILSQKQIITNRSFLSIQCSSTDFLLRLCLNLESWFNACVAIERALIIRKGVQFNKIKSKQTFKWIVLLLFFLNIVTTIQDPISRRLVEDKEDERMWCVVEYSSLIQIFNSIFYLFHFLLPLIINFFSALYIMTRLAQQRVKIHLHQTFRKHFHQQFNEHKHLVISPLILILLSLPRLVISFLPGCMKSFREPWLFLIGYFVPFIPPFLSCVIFILPSMMYRKEFLDALRRLKQRFRHYI
ncbi:unnamed protein product [Adineta steineri]|uniref:Uncharacterized protein n=1 Tax=Adineta steineri TaxID=433720 RepID=A0A813TVV4_9BILA|nr:unnamed protein product [Adineta steineri]CAF3642198.1 unnamed protein product [Adineta steineri]